MGPFVKFSCVSRIFHKHSRRPWDLLSTCVNFLCSVGHTVSFPCIRGTYHQLSMHLRDHPSTSRTTGDVLSPSVNFPCIQSVSAEHCVIFSKHSVRVWGLPSTCINFPCGWKTFRQLSMHPRDLPSTSINFSCIRGSQFPVNIPCGCGPFVNFPCIHRTFCLLVLTFRASARSSVNFLCGHGAFHKLQFSMHLQYFLSDSVYSLLIRGTIRPFFIRPRDFSSNICTSACPSVNFH